MNRSDLTEAYQPIWDMQSQRSTCVIPERPYLIDRRQEIELNQVALGIWRTVEEVVELARFSRLRLFREIAGEAKAFPDGVSMPPVIRANLINTSEGFKVVEIDPITAISIGETALLASVWEGAGYQVIEPPTRFIAKAVQERGESALSIYVPFAKDSYFKELSFLASELTDAGVEVRLPVSPPIDKLELSAFVEDRASLRAIRRDGWRSGKNPLWGSLFSLSRKDAILDLPEQLTDSRLRQALPRTVRAEDALDIFNPIQEVVFKPVNGTGSRGVFVGPAGEGASYKECIAQELLSPQLDEFGDAEGVQGRWVSRISIYAGRVGLCGAQVTARPAEGNFTNAHGQADAVQTTIAVKNNT